MVGEVSITKKDLELRLADYAELVKEAKIFKKELEQYPTPTEVAAHIAWIALMKGHLKDATVLDLGCGTGVLSTASILASAKRAICVEIDRELIETAVKVISENYPEVMHRILFVEGDVLDVEVVNVKVVLMNPPFGVQPETRGADLAFLDKALNIASSVYSIHKYSDNLVKLIEKTAEKRGFKLTWLEVLNLEIPMMYPRHRRRVYRVKALLVGLEKALGV
jgi:predicted RNA methylase